MEFCNDDIQAIKAIIKDLPKRHRWKMPVMVGNPTDTEYDSRIENFSTVTGIYRLDSGKKVFIIYQYPLVWVHRTLDFLMKWLTNTKMRKVSRQDWARTFISKSRIPVLYTDNKNVVVLPFILNINLFDLIVNGQNINDFGECEWGKKLDEEMATQLLRKVIYELNSIHIEKGAWGEVIIQNCIADNELNVHICDPEVRYYDNIPDEIQKARDLYDILLNAASCMNIRFGTNFSDTMTRMLEAYSTPHKDNILHELKILCQTPLSFTERKAFGYTLVRLALTHIDQYHELRSTLGNVLIK